MILVTGAAGKTGKAVVQALAARRADVRALIRPARTKRKPSSYRLPKQFHVGNFEDADALAAATSGVSAIYTSARTL